MFVLSFYLYGNRTRFITGKTKRFSIFLLWKLDFLFINFLSNPPKKNEKRNSYENKEKQCVLFLIYFLLFYLNFLLFCYGWSFVRCMPHTELWRKKLEKSRRLCRLRCCSRLICCRFYNRGGQPLRSRLFDYWIGFS